MCMCVCMQVQAFKTQYNYCVLHIVHTLAPHTHIITCYFLYLQCWSIKWIAAYRQIDRYRAQAITFFIHIINAVHDDLIRYTHTHTHIAWSSANKIRFESLQERERAFKISFATIATNNSFSSAFSPSSSSPAFIFLTFPSLLFDYCLHEVPVMHSEWMNERTNERTTERTNDCCHRLYGIFL